MKTIEELLKNLGRTEVLEFGLVTNRLPSVNIGGKFEPVDDDAPSTDVLLKMLVKMGGGAQVERLSERPTQWTTRLDGVGVIAVAAIMRKDVVQARFTVARREAKVPAAAPSSSGSHVAAAPPASSSAGRPSASHKAAPSLPPQSPPVSPGPPPSSSSSGASSSGALPVVTPPTDEWDDDDEPTVQTLSPPVSRRPREEPLSSARPRPPASEPKVEALRKSGEVPVAAGVVAEDRKVAEERERKALEERRAAEERAAHERRIIEERAAAERRAAEERKAVEARRAAEQRAAAEKRAAIAAAERAAAERTAADTRAAIAAAERAASERAAAEKRAAIAAAERAAAERAAVERAAAERRASERNKVERRISTPTSVDVVDVEITTSDSSNRASVKRLEALEAPSGLVASAPASSPALDTETERPHADGALASFLAMAVAARASDLHVVAGRPVLLRVASDLLSRTQPVTPEDVERIAREIVPPRLWTALETDGSCDFAIEHPQHGRFRVNASRQLTGYKLSMRVVPREAPTLSSLALPEGLAAVAKLARGLVLVTGPTGHGKTSTLGALVNLLNRDTTRHILTLEDPVELVHGRKRALVRQREIGTQARSLDAGLRAALREDADVLVIGELRLRDVSTVRLALDACETGRLVLATMSTPSAAKTIDSLIDTFPLAEQSRARGSLARALRLVVGQRLVPSADRTRMHVAAEVLPTSMALYTLIRDGRTSQIASLQQRGRASGVIRLDESLAELVRAQKVTVEVARQYAEPGDKIDGRSVPPEALRKA